MQRGAARPWQRPSPAAATAPARRSCTLAAAAAIVLLTVAGTTPALVLLHVAGASHGVPAWRTAVGFERTRGPLSPHVHDAAVAEARAASIARAGGLARRAARASPPPMHAYARVDRFDAGNAGDPLPSVGAAASRAPRPSAEPLVAALRTAEREPSTPTPSPALVAAPSPAVALPPLLVIGVPSVRRPGDPDYLMRALGYLTEQLVAAEPAARNGDGVALAGGVGAGLYPLRVRVIVMDNTRDVATRGDAPGGAESLPAVSGHRAFADAEARYCPPPACAERSVLGHRLRALPGTDADGAPSATVTFARAAADWAEPGAVDDGTPNVPGWRVRQQTRDVVALVRVANAVFGPPAAAAARGVERVYMFMEDDFRLCPSGVQALAYLLALAGVVHAPPLRPPWNALRVSFGLNGALVRLGADAAALADYLAEHAARRPPDHLTVEWFAGETAASAATKAGRTHAAFRYNVLEHFGRASSLRGAEAPLYAYCYDELNTAVVFEVEAFKARECPGVDVWPCPPPLEGEPTRPQPPVSFAALAARARADSVQTWAPAAA